ncbi:uncharacterized protein LOC144822305 [Lissotriton helveticus]
MGTRMAPSYANIFMGKLKNSILATFSIKPLVWLQYIDDIFIIWNAGSRTLEQFTANINNIHPTIKFTSSNTKQKHHLPFLDVLVTIHEHKITTHLYHKPTDAHLYLNWASCHPHHTKLSIIYSQALRIRRIFSNEETCKDHLQELATLFRRRGYPLHIVQQQIDKSLQLPREALIWNTNARNKSDRTPFIVDYHPSAPNYRNTLQKTFPLLSTCEKLQKVFPKLPVIAFRRTPNLRSLIVRAELKQAVTNAGVHCCDSKRCITCEYLLQTSSVTSYVTRRTYAIRQHLTCRSTCIIYVIQCQRQSCKKQYVGQTVNDLRTRFRNHKSAIINKKIDQPVANHFNLVDHSLSDLKIFSVEHVSKEEPLDSRENFWMYRLKSLHPDGLNITDGTI